MYRKNYLTGFLTIALFLIGSVAAFAQTERVAGRILLKGADGKLTPVEGALVEVYRTDSKAKLPTDTTDKKGQFSIVGLPLGAVFALNVSGPGIEPQIVPNIKAGMDRLDIDVKPGDGKKWQPEDEVRLALSGTSSTQTAEKSAELKKQEEEYKKKVAEIEEKNKKIENQTAVVRRALDEGNAAFNSKNYDVAVAKYEEGFLANPDYVGSAPILLNNKGQALRLRAVTVFNENAKKDKAAQTAAKSKVQEDLSAAAEAYNKSWTLLKNAPAADINDPKIHEASKLTALNGAKEIFRLMAFTRTVDTTKTEVAKTLLTEYVTMESDQVKKAEAQRIMGDIYLASGDSENAILEYKKALEINQNDADALAGIGLSLVVLGESNQDKTKFQEAADYLQRFIDVAPANHSLLASIKESLADLKNTQNVAPAKGKTTTTTKKKN